MARAVRVLQANAWYHVTARGIERRSIFADDRDRQHFLNLLQDWSERFRCRVNAFVLMQNHYHVLVQTLEPNLSRAMQWLNLSYGVWFNRRHRRVGYLFQGRFKAVLVEPESWGLSLSRYIHLNPVRIGMLGLSKAERRRQKLGLSGAPDPDLVRQRLDYLRTYRWSSYRFFAGYAAPPPWLHVKDVQRLGGSRTQEWARSYRESVEVAVREGSVATPWEEIRGRVALGSSQFLDRVRIALRGKSSTSVPSDLRARPGWKQIVTAVEGVKGVPWENFAGAYGDWGRDLALYLGRMASGLTLAELAAFARTGRTAVSMALRRFSCRLKKEKAIRKACAAARASLECEM